MFGRCYGIPFDVSLVMGDVQAKGTNAILFEGGFLDVLVVLRTREKVNFLDRRHPYNAKGERNEKEEGC